MRAFLVVVCLSILPVMVRCYKGDPRYGTTDYPPPSPFVSLRDAGTDH